MHVFHSTEVVIAFKFWVEYPLLLYLKSFLMFQWQLINVLLYCTCFIFDSAHRHIGETNMNLYSSRSHTIFRMVEIWPFLSRDLVLVTFSFTKIVHLINFKTIADNWKQGKIGGYWLMRCSPGVCFGMKNVIHILTK